MKRRWMRVCALALGVWMACAGAALGQSAPSANQNDAPLAESAHASSNAESNSGDETAQFKQSAAVRYLAKHTHLSVDHAYWLAVLINFAVVAGLIFWASKKTLPGVFRNRTADIQKQIAEARQASEDANRRLTDIEARMGRLDQEIAAIRSTAEKEAAAEEERIAAAAKEDARRIVESAEQEIAAAAKAARRDLTAYAADLSVTLAAKQIHVDTPTDQALLRQFVKQLPNGSGSEKKN